MDYKVELLNIISNITDDKILKYLYGFVVSFCKMHRN